MQLCIDTVNDMECARWARIYGSSTELSSQWVREENEDKETLGLVTQVEIEPATSGHVSPKTIQETFTYVLFVRKQVTL